MLTHQSTSLYNAVFGSLFIMLAFTACNPDDATVIDSSSALDTQLDQAILGSSNGIGRSFYQQPQSNQFNRIPQDPNNPLTTAKVDLGKFLFHETALGSKAKYSSGMGTYSCASCHHAAGGFQAGIKQGIGDGGSGFGIAGEKRLPAADYSLDSLDIQPVRTPTAMNGAYQKVMLWNGQFGATGLNAGTESQWTPGTPKATNNLGYEGLETQAIAGLSVHRMMIDPAFVQTHGYKKLFDEAFSDFPENKRYTLETAGLAIAAYERTILSNQAPFQQWLSGNSAALTEQQKEGAILFFSSAGCASCHHGPALNSMKFYAICMDDLDGPGIYGTNTNDADVAAKGRGGFTRNPADDYKFKVPQLYNLINSPFYGHGGSFTSIEEVIRYKNLAEPQNHDVPTEQMPSSFKKLNLDETEITQLTDFIENGLFDPNLKRYEPEQLPSGNCFPNADLQSRADVGCL